MKRDFTYVDDIVSGIVGVLKKPPEDEINSAPHRVLNIGNTKSEALMDFINLIEREIGKSADIEFLPMQPGDVKETYSDVTATKELTGYEPTTNINVGVPKFVAWYKEYYSSKKGV